MAVASQMPGAGLSLPALGPCTAQFASAHRIATVSQYSHRLVRHRLRTFGERIIRIADFNPMP
jgi:hypothetical protein